MKIMKMILKVIGVLILSIPMGFIGGMLISSAISFVACVTCGAMSDGLSNLITILCIFLVGVHNVLRLFGK